MEIGTMAWRGESMPVHRDACGFRCSWRGLQITAPDIEALRDGLAGTVALPAASYAELARLVPLLRYRPGWRFLLHADAGRMLTLVISASAGDRPGRLGHRFPVPPEGHVLAWPRWLLDRCLDADRHEAMEMFELAGGKPFYPSHGPGGGLYDIIEYGA